MEDLFAMKKRLYLLVLSCLLLTSCAPQMDTTLSVENLSWQDHYDLGVRYLSEGNYEEAILAFNAAIEIDPKQPDVYEKLAEIYIATGDTEQARKILEDGYAITGSETLQIRLAEIIASLVNGELREYFDEDDKLVNYDIFYVDPTTGYDRNDSYSPDGVLQNYYLYYYSEDGLTQTTECYSPADELLHCSTVVQDENGHVLSSVTDDGRETKYIYNEDGDTLGWDNYDDGVLTSYARFEGETTVYYDADGNKTGHN